MRSLVRLLLISTVAVLNNEWLLSKSYGDGSRLNGNAIFAEAFCDRSFALRQSRPFHRTVQVTRKNALSLPTEKVPFKTRTSQLEATPMPLNGGSEESLLLFWVTAFSLSHIGMSAIRQILITDVFGKFLADDILGIVGTGKFRLPDFWPGDSSGTNELFPDIETTGRQFYRVFYTMVSFLTLGSSFSIYLGIRNNNAINDMGVELTNVFGNSGGEMTILLSYAIATFAGAFSLASLVNASPLGLMPSFRQKKDEGSGFVIPSSSSGRAKQTETVAGDTLLGITRDDGLKFDPKGLTRIT